MVGLNGRRPVVTLARASLVEWLAEMMSWLEWVKERIGDLKVKTMKIGDSAKELL